MGPLDPYPDPDSQSRSGVEMRIRHKSSYYAIIACKNIGNWKLKNGVRCNWYIPTVEKTMYRILLKSNRVKCKVHGQKVTEGANEG
jgi:hypothetical protein